ncbi:hypothetical protein KP509_37G038700 [Ceratopteris richardii]|nr:hypothetical protein KP509_37G038700 [Ceratopteris richardii]
MAPFLSSGGYCSEALSYIVGMSKSGLVPYLHVEHHGDLAQEIFWRGLPADIKDIIIKSYKPERPLNNTIVICHSEPGAWYPSLFETHTCPPTGYEEPLHVIGRTMFETDRVNLEHVKRCNRMEEVWVPSDFNMKTFADSGVDPSKLVKVVQSVDVSFFSPHDVEAFPLPETGQVFALEKEESDRTSIIDHFIFLSIFKWEYRKGWHLLIKAYLREFSAKDRVALYILTNAYHTDRTYRDDIIAYVKEIGLKKPVHGWPLLYVNDYHIPQLRLPNIYKAANAFVLPSRGEGWGRPHVEAMSMGLPVIATNWSGMTEYMTETNSYPIYVERLVEVEEGPFKGHLWAEPSATHLQSLMRHVFMNPLEAEAKGQLARKTMVEKYSPEIVTKQIVGHLMRIHSKKTAKCSTDA